MPSRAIDFKSIAYAIPPPGSASQVYVGWTRSPARNFTGVTVSMKA
jgi:hypothetical protein